jgi:hypothetical protein
MTNKAERLIHHSPVFVLNRHGGGSGNIRAVNAMAGKTFTSTMSTYQITCTWITKRMAHDTYSRLSYETYNITAIHFMTLGATTVS